MSEDGNFFEVSLSSEDDSEVHRAARADPKGGGADSSSPIRRASKRRTVADHALDAAAKRGRIDTHHSC